MLNRNFFKYAPAILVWLIFQAFGALCQDIIFKETEKSLKNLEELNKTFGRLSRKDPENEGAEQLKKGIFKVCIATREYMKYNIDKDSLKAIILPVLKEAKRYDSKNSRKTQDELNKILKELSKHPDRNSTKTNSNTNANNAEEATIIKNLESKNQGEPQSKTESAKITYETQKNDKPNLATKEEDSEQLSPVKEDSTDSSKSSNSFIYIVLLLFLIAILLLAYLVQYVHKKAIQDLVSRIKNLEDDVKSLTITSGTGQGGSVEIQLMKGDFNKRISQPEHNTVEFLQIVEDRMNKIEANLHQSSTIPANSLKTSPENQNKLLERIAYIEKVLHINPNEELEAPFQLKITVPIQLKNLENLYENIQHLVQTTDIPRLKELGTYTHPTLKMAIIAQNCDNVDIYSLASIAQLAYVSAFNEQQDEAYSHTLQSLSSLGFVVLDSLALNKTALSADWAENIDLNQYKNNLKLRGIEYPNTIVLQKKIENQFPDLTKVKPKTILAVLQPTVLIKNNQSEVLLQKGCYIIKP